MLACFKSLEWRRSIGCMSLVMRKVNELTSWPWIVWRAGSRSGSGAVEVSAIVKSSTR